MTQQLEWKKAITMDVPDENCPNCGEPLRFDQGYMTCPNCQQSFGDFIPDGPSGQSQPSLENISVPQKIEQPIYKWSYDGHQLLIWPVNEYTGRPHHIEVTGLEFYRLAQGRVYRDKEGNLEILVWEDRGTPEMQDEAIEAVENYLKKKLGEEAAYYSFQTEGDVYQKQDPNNPNWDEIVSAYFQHPVKTKRQPWLDKLRGKPYNPLQGLL